MINQYQDIFETKNKYNGRTNGMQHQINNGDADLSATHQDDYHYVNVMW